MRETSCYGATITKKKLSAFYAGEEVSDFPDALFKNVAIPHFDKLRKLSYDFVDNTLVITYYYSNMPYSMFGVVYYVFDDVLTLCEQMVLCDSKTTKSIVLLPKNHFMIDDIEALDKIFQYNQKEGVYKQIYTSLKIYETIDCFHNDLIIMSMAYDSISDDGDEENQKLNKYILQLQKDKLPRIRYDEREDGDFMAITKEDGTPLFITINNYIFGIKASKRYKGNTLVAIAPDANGKLETFEVVHDEHYTPIGTEIERVTPVLELPKFNILTSEYMQQSSLCVAQNLVRHQCNSNSILCEHKDGTIYLLSFDVERKLFIAAEEILY